ncbi:dissimilatory sulfite reductase (desulfoviridin) alpha/beta subunit [Methanomicrobium sp. W14]|uniref:4Fe-4S dicluster domain-containing protein n=1 Tax=Methanomicrobium sp. W14 TaxID=2817839 RepID=UPI001AE94B2A|nr:4Fe-4S dicluster domain-containing protein [Methanomicrobium sp. W14]MBP2133749.1 dissimilatory sulfite reductase (desulfoviridin) alpha/beta subunit [Methanomicrobium sp. W14]
MGKENRFGILKEQDKKFRTIRIRAPAGNLNSKELALISSVSGKYGRGEVCFTSRLNVEIPYVPFDKLNDAVSELEAGGLVIGGTGASVRAVFACKAAFCPHGIINSREAALKIEEKFGGRKLPVKFKAAISGCPNNCGRAQLNDLGFVAFLTPEVLTSQSCDGCGLCISVCKEDAISLNDPKDGISIDYSLCVSCGDCVRACKKGNITPGKKGLHVYIGGRAGREIKSGILYENEISEGDITDFAGKVIDYIDDECTGHERLCSHLERVGIEKLAHRLG